MKLWNRQDRKLIATLRGHSDWISSIAFSPDGKLLASASKDKTITLWNVADRSEITKLFGHTGAVNCLAFSPDGKILASGSDDHAVTLWEIPDGRKLFSLYGHTGAILSLAFDEKGVRLASGGTDKNIVLWDVFNFNNVTRLTLSIPSTTNDFDRNYNKLAILSGHNEAVTSIAFSSDGTILASGSADKTVKLWKLASHEVWTLPGHADPVFSVAFSPDGSVLASGSGDIYALGDHSATLTLWNVIDGTAITTLQGLSNAVLSLAFSPEGKMLAAGNYDKTVTFWDFDEDHLLSQGCAWLQGYLKNNPHVNETDRALCDDLLERK